MLPWSTELAGRMHEHVISSELPRGNPLGDPHERPLLVYTPPGYDDSPDRAYPSVYVIQGYTGHVAMWRNRVAFRQPFPETADAMFAGGDAPPAVVVYADAWTAYGGSQFVDSPGTGRYHSYLCDEVVAYVDARYRTIPDAAHRAITGKSSGGFGAMITPLPFDPVTGVLRPDVWQRWLDWDPVRMVPRYGAALRGLRGIWIDAGTRDDFNLDVGAAAFRSALLDAGVDEELIRFELFDASHAGIDYRYPLSLAWLCERIAGE